MTDHRIPHVGHLATSGARARAAAMLNTAGTHGVDGTYLADVLDGLSAAVLALAFVPSDDGRAILAALWSDR